MDLYSYSCLHWQGHYLGLSISWPITPRFKTFLKFKHIFRKWYILNPLDEDTMNRMSVNHVIIQRNCLFSGACNEWYGLKGLSCKYVMKVLWMQDPILVSIGGRCIETFAL